MKEKIRQFYKEVFWECNAEAARKYLAENYIQHNPGVENGREGFIRTFTKAYEQGKKMNLNILQIVEAGDMIAVRISAGNTPQPGSVVDFYRINQDELLCEHWDVFHRP